MRAKNDRAVIRYAGNGQRISVQHASRNGVDNRSKRKTEIEDGGRPQCGFNSEGRMAGYPRSRGEVKRNPEISENEIGIKQNVSVRNKGLNRILRNNRSPL